MTTMRPAPIHAPPLVESLGLLERAIGYTRVALGHVTPATLRNPTPCTDWDLSALLAHMVDSLDALTEAADVGYVALSVPCGPATGVPAVEQLRVKACSLLGAWSHAAGTEVLVGDRLLGSSLLACAGALEVAVHGWDVARATGAELPLPAVLAADLMPWAHELVVEQDRPGRFAPVLDVPADAGPATRLLGVLGRGGPTRA
jgi:uncharacterized protein (TIGR03086 family)